MNWIEITGDIACTGNGDQCDLILILCELVIKIRLIEPTIRKNFNMKGFCSGAPGEIIGVMFHRGC